MSVMLSRIQQALCLKHGLGIHFYVTYDGYGNDEFAYCVLCSTSHPCNPISRLRKFNLFRKEMS